MKRVLLLLCALMSSLQAMERKEAKNAPKQWERTFLDEICVNPDEAAILYAVIYKELPPERKAEPLSPEDKNHILELFSQQAPEICHLLEGVRPDSRVSSKTPTTPRYLMRQISPYVPQKKECPYCFKLIAADRLNSHVRKHHQRREKALHLYATMRDGKRLQSE